MKNLSFEDKVSAKHRDLVFTSVLPALQKNAQQHKIDLIEKKRSILKNIYWFFGVTSSVALGFALWLRERHSILIQTPSTATNESLAMQNHEMLLEQEWLEDFELLENLDILEQWEES